MNNGLFISRADLWGKLIEQKRHNIEVLDSSQVAYHVNMGINQAIGIMNSMPAFTISPAELEAICKALDNGLIMKDKNER